MSALDAFDVRVLPADAQDAACICCGDSATRDDLCDDCGAVVDIASEHAPLCDCGACGLHAKIMARRVAGQL